MNITFFAACFKVKQLRIYCLRNYTKVFKAESN